MTGDPNVDEFNVCVDYLPGWTFRSVDTSNHETTAKRSRDVPLAGCFQVVRGTGIVRGELDGYEYVNQNKINWNEWKNHRNSLGVACAHAVKDDTGDKYWKIVWNSHLEVFNKAGTMKPYQKRMTQEEFEKVCTLFTEPTQFSHPSSHRVAFLQSPQIPGGATHHESSRQILCQNGHLHP